MGKRKIQKALLGVLSLLGVLVSPTWNKPQPALVDITCENSNYNCIFAKVTLVGGQSVYQ
jgi:hypothetical protein